MNAPSTAGTQEGRDPFASFSLDTLVSGAARLRPDTIALVDSRAELTYRAFAARAAALARLLAEHGLKHGERVLLAGGAEASLVVAAVAALRAGLEPVFAPLDLEAGQLAAYAKVTDAAALLATTRYGPYCPTDVHFAAIASAASIRLVATLGPGELDGGVDLGPEAIAQFSRDNPDEGLDRGKQLQASPGRIITLERCDGSLKPIFHRQATLIVAALDFVARARLDRDTPVISTLPPMSFAGLVAGPVAALLAGAALHLHGPFDTTRFLDMLDRVRPAQLVAPHAAAENFVDPAIARQLASLILVSRLKMTDPAPILPACACPCPLLDLYAIDERATIAEQRVNGEARWPTKPHYISFDNARILVIEAKSDGDTMSLEGAGVTRNANLGA